MKRLEMDRDSGENKGWEGNALHGVLVRAPRFKGGTVTVAVRGI